MFDKQNTNLVNLFWSGKCGIKLVDMRLKLLACLKTSNRIDFGM